MPSRSPSAPARGAFTLVEIMIVVVIIGLLAAMSVAQFGKIRVRSQDAAVLHNARTLAGAAAQYYLSTGATTVAFDHLVGSTNYVKRLEVVASEAYPDVFASDMAITIGGVGGVRTITYAP